MKAFVFSWWDAMTFGLAAVLVLIGAIVIAASGAALEPTLGAFATALAFAGIYARLIHLRWLVWKRVRFTTVHGLHVIFDTVVDDYSTADSVQLAIEAVTEDAISRWAVAGCLNSRAMVRGCLLVLKPQPFELHRFTGRFASVTLRGIKGMLVGYRRRMEASALGHELGHVILRAWGKPYEEADLRKWATEKGVPY